LQVSPPDGLINLMFNYKFLSSTLKSRLTNRQYLSTGIAGLLLIGAVSTPISTASSDFFGEIKTTDYGTAPVSGGAFCWRGYSFKLSQPTTVTHLIGGGTTAFLEGVSEFKGAIFTASTPQGSTGGSPNAILAEVIFPETSVNQVVALPSTIQLEAETWYFLAQGSVKGTVLHHYVESLNASDLIAASARISDWLPTGGSTGTAYFWGCNVEPTALLNANPSTTSNKPAIGFRYLTNVSSVPVIETSNDPLSATLLDTGGGPTALYIEYGTSVDNLSNPTSITSPSLYLEEAGYSGPVPYSYSAGLSGLNSATTYYYRARAINDAGRVDGAIKSFTTPAAPSAPTITSVEPRNGSLQINFTIGSEVDVTNYEYSINNGSTYVTRSPSSTLSPIIITGLVNGTTYTLKIRAINQGVRGTESGSATGTPQAPTVPDAPTSLTSAAGSNQVSLSWEAGSDGGAAIEDYVIEYSTDNSTWITFTDDVSAATSATITGLSNGTLYYFRVTAVNAAGTGSPSTAITATPVAPPAPQAPASTPTLEPTPSPTSTPTPTRTPLTQPTTQVVAPTNPLPTPTPTPTQTPTTQSTPQTGSPNNFAPLVIRTIEEVVESLKPVAFDALVGLISKAIDEIRSSIGQNALVLLLDRNTAESLVSNSNSIILETPTAVLKDGVAEPARIVVIDTSQLQVVSGEGGLLRLEAKDGEDAVPVDSQGRLQMLLGNLVEAEGTGFAGNSEFAVWLFSEPTMLGIGKTDAAGRFFASFPVEKSIPLGDHTLQVVGVTSSGEQRSISLPVIVLDNKETAMNNSIENVIQVSQNPVQKWFDSISYLAILMFLVIFLALWMLWIMRRRKDEEEEIDLQSAQINELFIAPRPTFEAEATVVATKAATTKKPAAKKSTATASRPRKKTVPKK